MPLKQNFSAKIPAALFLGVILLLTPVTWARAATVIDWSRGYVQATEASCGDVGNPHVR